MKFDNVISIGNYVCTSVVCKDYHAIDFIQKNGDVFVSIRCAYRTESAAQEALAQLKKNGNIKTPDYNIERFVCKELLCHKK